MTRLLREHPPIDVELDATAGSSRSAGPAGGSRSRSATAGGSRSRWWREPIARDYFKVVGPRWLALVYLDRVDGTWHLERLYD